MGLFDYFKRRQAPPQQVRSSIRFIDGSEFSWGDICTSGGYMTLAECPEVVTGCSEIARLIASMTIYSLLLPKPLL